ncbi:MAG TPA: TIGR02597 family protein [Candidatus Methylacidiphilales bacterium]|jgi:uncharacterized protein (TIGR02597 family)|nr:TIGR02597 family protein [Candidatus Methylacidiphilales bacterium]
MHKKIIYLLTGMALALGALSARAQTATVATIPEGMMLFTLTGGTTNYLSLPLTNNVTYTSSVSAVTGNTISVADTPAPFTTSLTAPGSPYFVKFLSGSETGRVMLITANTDDSLTLDTTDNSNQTVSLTTSGFSVAVGDTFEIFPGDTLASMFGTNTTQNPLLLHGSTSTLTADTVSIYVPALFHWQSYYFNTTSGCWEMGHSSANANNTILYPYGTLAVNRRLNETTATTLVLTGRVAEVPILTKTTGSNSVVYGSTGYPADTTLSQFQLGPSWVTGTSVLTADTVSIWDSALDRFNTYYQEPDSTWRSSTDATTDQSNLVISGGNSVAFMQRAAVSGAPSFLTSSLPYSLN